MEGIPPGYTQEDILAALTAQSKRGRPATLSFEQLDDLNPGVENDRKLYCPRDGCSCVIIGPGGATLVEAVDDILPDEEGAPFPPRGNRSYWHVTGGPYAFDNIGFSRATGATLPPSAPGAGSGQVKWLSCAECDLGPLGYTFEGGQESWLAADRIKYGENK